MASLRCSGHSEPSISTLSSRLCFPSNCYLLATRCLLLPISLQQSRHPDPTPKPASILSWTNELVCCCSTPSPTKPSVFSSSFSSIATERFYNSLPNLYPTSALLAWYYHLRPTFSPCLTGPCYWLICYPLFPCKQL